MCLASDVLASINSHTHRYMYTQLNTCVCYFSKFVMFYYLLIPLMRISIQASVTTSTRLGIWTAKQPIWYKSSCCLKQNKNHWKTQHCSTLHSFYIFKFIFSCDSHICKVNGRVNQTIILTKYCEQQAIATITGVMKRNSCIKQLGRLSPAVIIHSYHQFIFDKHLSPYKYSNIRFSPKTTAAMQGPGHAAGREHTRSDGKLVPRPGAFAVQLVRLLSSPVLYH